MKTLPKIMLGLASAVVLPVVSLSSCSVGGFTNEASAKKLPQPLQGMTLNLMREEKIMLTRCSEGSARLAQSTATIAEGCGLEKEAQKLRAYAGSLKKTSSSEDQRKYCFKGQNLINDVNNKIASSANATVQSKEKFKQGYIERNRAKQALDAVMLREGVNAGVKAAAIINYGAKNKDGLKSNPMAAVQTGMALNYALLPARFVYEDYVKFQKEQKTFDEQCQQIGKKYAIALPAPAKAAPISMPKGFKLP